MRTVALTFAMTCMFLFLIRAQKSSDSIVELPVKQPPISEQPVSNLLQSFTGGFGSLVQGNKTSGTFDLSLQTYHYFLVTGRRYKNDSVHEMMKSKVSSFQDLYKGFHFYLVNRACMDLDTLRAIANNYLTSLIGAPMTLRINKELFLTKARKITANSFAPVLSLLISGDGRLIPYGDRTNNLNFGASGHLYLSFSAKFKRIELDHTGKEIDNGTMYLSPVFGIAYGTNGLFHSVLPGSQIIPILTSGCRIGFSSQVNKIKDFSLLLNYSLTDILGPKLRAGILLGTGS